MREEVLLRKLIADGEGTGEERRYQGIFAILRTLRTKQATKSDALKVLKQLEYLELSVRKQRLIAEMSHKQTVEYEEMADRVDKEIARSGEKMAQAKQELVAARLVRRNRQEYALLARMIEDVPSRAETKRKLEEIHDELIQQQKRQKHLEAKLSERRNHLHAFNIILANFQKFLKDDDEGVETKEDSEDNGEKKDDDKSKDSEMIGPSLPPAAEKEKDDSSRKSKEDSGEPMVLG